MVMFKVKPSFLQYYCPLEIWALRKARVAVSEWFAENVHIKASFTTE